MIRLRSFSFLCIASISLFIGWCLYSYFFDISKPVLIIQGLENNGWYAGDLECSLKSSKKGDAILWLDDKQLSDGFFIAAHDNHSFIIPSKTISNGMHTLKVDITDTKFNHNRGMVQRSFYVDNTPLQAALIKQDEVYKVLQGRTLHIQFQTNKEISQATVEILSKEYECFPESKKALIYETFIPIECEQVPNEYLFTLTIKDKVGNNFRIDNKVQVVMYPFKKTTMFVSEEKMKEEESLGGDNKRFEEMMETITLNSPREKLWKGTFCAPMDIAKITCEYGTIRTTQRKGRYAHKALDVVNTPGCVIWAPQDGVVAMKERFAFTGNTVVIDHGWGIISMFCHLENFSNIKVGDHISQGNPIGTMGKTGYATGYHLHWEMRIKGIQIDPMQWTRPTF